MSEKRSTNNFNRLVRLNRIMAIVHALQAVVVLVLSNDATRSITTSYLQAETTSSGGVDLVSTTQSLWDLPFAWLIATFFFLSAAAHALIGWVITARYKADLQKGMNQARWYEYSLSASVMMVAIALLSGVFDLSSLLLIFMLTAIMNLMGLVMEVHNQTTKQTDWLSYNIGVVAGIVPWVVIGLYFLGAELAGGPDSNIPTFVYWIYGSIFLFFNCFALNMVLQYKQLGKWKDYVYGEQTYIWLSLIAKSLLAWQVYAGVLQPS